MASPTRRESGGASGEKKWNVLPPTKYLPFHVPLDDNSMGGNGGNGVPPHCELPGEYAASLLGHVQRLALARDDLLQFARPRRVAVSTRELRGATRARDPRGEYKLVFLPGLYKVAKLLNGTTGVRAVTSSRISRALAAPPDLITDDDAQLSIAINGTGRRGAHRLCASGGAGWRDKTQQLYVECEGGFDEHNLREVLRALSLVLHFELLPPGETPPTVA